MARFYLTNLDSDISGYKLALVDMRNPAASVVTGSVATAVAGNIQVTAADGTTALAWITKPFLADVAFTALPIMWVSWAKESNLSANANIGSPALYEYTTSEQATFAGTSPAAAELTATMARTIGISTNLTATTIDAGNRLVIKVFVTPTGTMGAANGVLFSFDGATEGAEGDTYVILNEAVRLSEAQVGSGTTVRQPGYSQAFFQNVIDNINAAEGADLCSFDQTVRQLVDDFGFQRDNN